MAPRDFCFWIDGVLASAEVVNGSAVISADALAEIRKRLNEAQQQADARPPFQHPGKDTRC